MMLREPLDELSIESQGREDGEARQLTCHGRCHCGEVQFVIRIDPAKGTRKCNCSFCTQTRFWKVFVNAENIEFRSGATALREYRFGDKLVEHDFCRHCGTQVFMKADCVANEYVINAACLDARAQAMMSLAPLRFEDGRNDDWWSIPAETSHL